MSGTRKLKRRRIQRPQRRERGRRFLLRHILLVAGVVVALLGAAYGLREYQVYLAGRPEQVRNSRLGTTYLPALPAGDPGRRASAYAGFAAAGVGAALAVFALVMGVIDKKLTGHRQTEETSTATERAGRIE